MSFAEGSNDDVVRLSDVPFITLMKLGLLIPASFALFVLVIGLVALLAGRGVDFPGFTTARTVGDLSIVLGSFIFFQAIAVLWGVMVLKLFAGFVPGFDFKLKVPR